MFQARRAASPKGGPPELGVEARSQSFHVLLPREGGVEHQVSVRCLPALSCSCHVIPVELVPTRDHALASLDSLTMEVDVGALGRYQKQLTSRVIDKVSKEFYLPPRATPSSTTGRSRRSSE